MTPNYKTRDAVLGLRATCTPGSLMESTCDLALSALDGEQDRALGAAVRLAIGHRNPCALAEKDVRWLVGVVCDHFQGVGR